MSRMSRKELERFTHVSNFTRYMSIVGSIVVGSGRAGLEILDVPAGNGLLAEQLRSRGHRVTCADINAARPEYVFSDMERPLPFGDSSFDAVICLEGIEHVIDSYALVREFSRILRPGGFVVVSLPNVQAFYSRLEFLLTGTFYGFEPEGPRHPRGRLMDRGHVSPLSLVQLNYLFGEFGLSPTMVTGDRVKKHILVPLYLVLWPLNVLLGELRSRRCGRADVRRLYRLLTGFRALTGRTLITVWEQRDGEEDVAAGGAARFDDPKA